MSGREPGMVFIDAADAADSPGAFWTKKCNPKDNILFIKGAAGNLCKDIHRGIHSCFGTSLQREEEFASDEEVYKELHARTTIKRTEFDQLVEGYSQAALNVSFSFLGNVLIHLGMNDVLDARDRDVSIKRDDSGQIKLRVDWRVRSFDPENGIKKISPPHGRVIYESVLRKKTVDGKAQWGFELESIQTDSPAIAHICGSGAMIPDAPLDPMSYRQSARRWGAGVMWAAVLAGGLVTAGLIFGTGGIAGLILLAGAGLSLLAVAVCGDKFLGYRNKALACMNWSSKIKVGMDTDFGSTSEIQASFASSRSQVNEEKSVVDPHLDVEPGQEEKPDGTKDSQASDKETLPSPGVFLRGEKGRG